MSEDRRGVRWKVVASGMALTAALAALLLAVPWLRGAVCRQGYRWWEIDITYTVLRILGLLGIARDCRGFRTAREGSSL